MGRGSVDKRRMNLFRPAALALTCAATLAACGGSNDSDALSASEYRTQGNDLCQSYEAKAKAIPQPESVEDISAYAEATQKQLSGLITSLDELKPPEDLQKQHDELVALGQKSVDSLDELVAAGKTGDQAQIEAALKGGSELDGQSDKLAKELGLNKCAES